MLFHFIASGFFYLEKVFQDLKEELLLSLFQILEYFF